MEFNKEIKLKNGETIIIRNPKSDDAEALTNYYNKLFFETENYTTGKGSEPQGVEQTEKTINGYSKEGNTMIVAVLNDKIVAHCDICRVSSRARLLHRCELGVGTLKKHWGKGIAGKLLVEIIAIAKQMNYEQIDLNVITSNKPAIKLYKSFGFRKTGYIKNALKYANGSYADGLQMYLNIRKQ